MKSEIYLKTIKLWLMFILCFLPFKFYIVKNLEGWNSLLLNMLRRVDLLTVIILLPAAFIGIFRKKRIVEGLLLTPIVVLGISGLVSGIANGNSLFVTMSGIFDYVKYFLVIFVFARFFRRLDDFKRVYHYLLVTGLILAVGAIIQELWAVVSVYLLGSDINNSAVYLFQYIEDDSIRSSFWRFGMYRVSPFMSSPIIFGLYSLFVLIVYLSYEKKINVFYVIILIAVSILSFSRIVYLCLTLVVGLEMYKGRKGFLVLAALLVLIAFSMTSLPDFNLMQWGNNFSGITEYNDDTEGAYRVYARHKAIEVWMDHPVMGVGPGMFGGVVSVKHQSPVYEEYNFLLSNQNLKRIWGIDQFWFQLIAETGIVGVSAFAGLYLCLIVVFYNLMQQTVCCQHRNLLAGLILFTLIIPVYSFGITLNISQVLFSYSAIAGIIVGCISNCNDEEIGVGCSINNPA